MTGFPGCPEESRERRMQKKNYMILDERKKECRRKMSTADIFHNKFNEVRGSSRLIVMIRGHI